MYHESKIVSVSKPFEAYKALGIGLICFIIVVSGFYYHVVTQSIKNFQIYSFDQESEAKRMQEQKEELDAQMRFYETTIEDFQKLLFKERDVSVFLSGISRIAREHNVNLVSVRNLAQREISIEPQEHNRMALKDFFSLGRSNLVISVVPFQVVIEGTLEDIFEVLSSLEQTRQILAINQFNFNVQSFPVMRVNFQVELYGI